MKTCIFHPVPLPPKDYGGVERVVLWLARGLVERGHEVWVGAQEGSVLPKEVRLLPIPKGQESALDLGRKLPPGTDLVHFMAPPEAGFEKTLGCPFVLTVHGNARPGERYPKNSIFLSRDHAKRHHAEIFVYNGLDPDEYIYDPKAHLGAYLFLSKTSWSVKNVLGAIRLCRKARVPLRVAGGRRPISARVRVALNPGMKWIGPVAGKAKALELSQARGLVFPVLWPEPFGLVVAEALISGTPVLASNRGSLPELVNSEVGAVLNSEEEWVEALSRTRRWVPERCRSWALEMFHYAKMAAGYENLYLKVIAGEELHPHEPGGF